MKTVADAVAEALKRACVSVVFGLPGGEVVALLDAFRRYDIRFVLVRNESSAAFMADTFSRITGTPGACLSTLGPGAANAVAGIAHGYLDRCPLLFLAGQMPERLHDHHTHQTLDLPRLFAPITKGSFALRGAGAEQTLHDALDLCIGGKPGPVHLQVDKETATQIVEPGPSALVNVSHDEPSPPIGHEDLARAALLLHEAEKPLIVAGLGLEPAGAYGALKALAEATAAPVITTPKAKGALPADHPLSLGTIGLTMTDPAYAVLEEADCVVAVGFDVVELVKPWTTSPPLVWIAPWANAGPRIDSAIDLVGPLEPTLREFVVTLKELFGAESRESRDWGNVRVSAHRESLAAQALPEPAKGRLLPQQVLAVVRRAAPRSVSVSVDVGSHKILSCLSWPALAPNHFFVSNGLSSMGFGLPSAMAAALARPRQHSFCFTGDAGLGMVGGELGVLRELELPVIVVVFNDGAIDLIRSHQLRQGYPVFGTEFEAVDHVLLARAHGVAAERVSDEASLALALERALERSGPSLIDVMIDPVSYPTTPR